MALFDELLKIAEESPQPIPRKELAKRWLKNTALVVAGAGAGEAVARAGDWLLSKKFGPDWAGKIPPHIAGPIVGASTMALLLLRRELAREENRKMEAPL